MGRPDAKDALVTGLVNDALAVLDALDRRRRSTAEQADAVGLLALVAGQDVEPGDGDGTWRIARRVAPDRMISTVDPEARHMHKSVSEYRDGYKAHIAVEPETGLITAAALTPANAGDGPTGVALLAGEEPGLQVLADSAYGSGEARAALRAAQHHQAIKADPAAHARCPAGSTATTSSSTTTPAPSPAPPVTPSAIAAKGDATFGARCRGCPLANAAPPPKTGRTIVLHISEHDAELVEARRAWRDGDFAADYRQWRPMVERSIAWLVAHGHRRVRYRGIERNQLGLSHRVAAINLRRLVNLGLTHDGHRLGAQPNAGPGTDNEGATLRHQATRATGSHPQRRLFGRS